MRFWGAELQFPEGTIDLRQRSGGDETGRAGLMRAGAGATGGGGGGASGGGVRSAGGKDQIGRAHV